MARKKKALDVQKFGGSEKLADITLKEPSSLTDKEYSYDVNHVEAKSDVKIEQDEGYGGAAIIRQFVFGMNPHVFNEVKPTAQDLFNAHLKGIETMLWRDGMKVMPEVEPRLSIDTKNLRYTIYVGATPMRGHILKERPQRLTDILNG